MLHRPTQLAFTFSLATPMSLRVLTAATLFCLAHMADAVPVFEDTMAQRTKACTGCRGEQGRAWPDGYYPRLAGKPAGYLYNQLLNIRDGWRHYQPMASMLKPLSDVYLMEMAQYFSRLQVAYPAPAPTVAPKDVLARGHTLVTQGDPGREIPPASNATAKPSPAPNHMFLAF
jgi:cytochrome c553